MWREGVVVVLVQMGMVVAIVVPTVVVVVMMRMLVAEVVVIRVKVRVVIRSRRERTTWRMTRPVVISIHHLRLRSKENVVNHSNSCLRPNVVVVVVHHEVFR
jgi:hypothetical protein